MKAWSLGQPTLAGLLLEAYACLQKLKSNPQYKFCVHCWHDPKDGQCHIDLAGAMMAVKLGADPSKELYPEDFPQNEHLAFYALDCLETGSISGAATRWRKVARSLGVPYNYKAGLSLKADILVQHGEHDLSEQRLMSTVEKLRTAGL